MKSFRLIFENIKTGEIDSIDIMAYSSTEAKNEWEYARNHEERKTLRWCGVFLTPSHLFSDEDFA